MRTSVALALVLLSFVLPRTAFGDELLLEVRMENRIAEIVRLEQMKISGEQIDVLSYFVGNERLARQVIPKALATEIVESFSQALPMKSWPQLKSKAPCIRLFVVTRGESTARPLCLDAIGPLSVTRVSKWWRFNRELLGI